MLIAWAGGAAFVVSLAYLVYFFAVTLGSPAGSPAERTTHIVVDIVLFSAFALHHSLLARPAGKRLVARVVPARFERSLYVWVASLLAVGLCLFWQPVAGMVYRVDGWWRGVFWGVQAAGLVITARGASAISALELAGIRQAAGHGAAGPLRIVGPFRIVRHPIYLGWMLMVFGAPTMTANRLLFATISSLYLVMAIPWEERSLVNEHGERYAAYARQVRWRVVPGIW